MGKSGKACTICVHDKRAAIDVGLVHGVPMQVLADRFGASKDAIQRHSANHLSPAQRAAILAQRKPTEIDLDRLREAESENLLASLVAQRARLQSHAEMAASYGDTKGAVAAENSIQGNLTLVAKLLGQLAVQHNVTHTNILVSADYIRLRQAIVQALRPFPDAAVAVGRALAALEAEAAKDITAAANKLAKPAPVIEHEAAPPPRVIPPPPY
jgi:hypothetical protein